MNILAGECKHIESTELHFVVLPVGVRRVKVGAALDDEDHCLSVDNELSFRVWLSRSTGSGSSWRIPKSLKHFSENHSPLALAGFHH